MHSLRHNGIDEFVFRVNFVLGYAFLVGILFDGEIFVYERFAQSFCAFAALPLMRLVDDNGKISALQVVKIFIRIQKFLYGADDDALFIVDGGSKPARVFFFVNCFHKPRRVVKTRDRVLQLAVEDNAVCNDDYRIKNRFAVFVVQRCEPIGDPRDGV